jgi:hypothetical protein
MIDDLLLHCYNPAFLTLFLMDLMAAIEKYGSLGNGVFSETVDCKM